MSCYFFTELFSMLSSVYDQWTSQIHFRHLIYKRGSTKIETIFFLFVEEEMNKNTTIIYFYLRYFRHIIITTEFFNILVQFFSSFKSQFFNWRIIFLIINCYSFNVYYLKINLINVSSLISSPINLELKIIVVLIYVKK